MRRVAFMRSIEMLSNRLHKGELRKISVTVER